LFTLGELLFFSGEETLGGVNETREGPLSVGKNCPGSMIRQPKKGVGQRGGLFQDVFVAGKKKGDQPF